jgi:Domain of unknown function (DUF4177)
MGATVWEYVVYPAGGGLKRAKPEELTGILNQAASEGWELFQVVPQEDNYRLLLVLRRPATPRTRREAGWPGMD